MSLVERALQKIRDSRGASASAGQETMAAPPRAPHGLEARGEQQSAPVRIPTREAGEPARNVNIDRDALHALSVLPPPHQEKQLAGQYRDIKRPLIAGELGRGGQQVARGHLIMVASALAGERQMEDNGCGGPAPGQKPRQPVGGKLEQPPHQQSGRKVDQQHVKNGPRDQLWFLQGVLESEEHGDLGKVHEMGQIETCELFRQRRCQATGQPTEQRDRLKKAP